MNVRALIEALRGHLIGWPLSREQQDLLADLAESGIEFRKGLVEGESASLDDGWLRTPGPGEFSEQETSGDVALLERCGLIERSQDDERLVRFLDERAA